MFLDHESPRIEASIRRRARSRPVRTFASGSRIFYDVGVPHVSPGDGGEDGAIRENAG
jgi:hypothetical protein